MHDAEDAVQETLLRAWRSYEGFEGRSSVRSWLYRIATNAALRSIEQRGRRPLPSGIRSPADDATQPLDPPRGDIAWLEPIPDRLLASGPDDPAVVVGLRGSIRLAFVASLQHLPGQQRAVLILREVLGLSAAEVAGLLDTTTAAVNSSLQRARAQLAQAAPSEDTTFEPIEPRTRALVDRYVTALENADLAALRTVLLADVALEMPPTPTWFRGRDVVLDFLAARVLDRPGGLRLVPTRANGQPALAEYRLDGAVYPAVGIQVLDVADGRVGHIVVFFDTELFVPFGPSTCSALVSESSGPTASPTPRAPSGCMRPGSWVRSPEIDRTGRSCSPAGTG